MEESKSTASLAADDLSTEQKERLHEVADQLLAIYETLIAMRYIDHKALIRGPQSLSEELLAVYKKMNLDPAIIYLYSIMPYIDPIETEDQNFFQGGTFFNPANIQDVERSRDPRYLYPEAEDDYMRPWYTPLSNCSERSPIVIYDAKEHRIWIVDQIENHTTDPAFRTDFEKTESEKEGSNWGDDGSSNWSDDDENVEDADLNSDAISEGSSEWEDDDDAIDSQELDGMVADQDEVIEYNEGFDVVSELDEWERQEAAGDEDGDSLEPVKNRPAGDVLRDINRWYRQLKHLPGEGSFSWLEPAILKPLYVGSGWPDDFDGDQFEVDMARAYATKRARYDAEEPLRKVECYQGWSEHSDRDIEQSKKDISEAKTLDDEWKARFKLWQAEERSERNAQDLRDAKKKADKLCPGGKCQKDEELPLWQLEKMRVETQWKRESVQRSDLPASKEQFKDNPEQIRYMEARHRRAQHQLEVYEKAFLASKADAERLCPGRTFQETTGIKSLGREDTLTRLASQKELVEWYEAYVQTIRDFAGTVPTDASEARDVVGKEIQRNEKALQGVRDNLARTERWFAEHGNTD